ncbi:GrpB-like predicted nucleotidyltransferase (UPF0157 family) [Psychromicrobium silvestre]|uniref:GrpB-like predicted nucleotidyltransferase (UPF0157 family) n=1 Tax=Psychromicrobium silvestre TaxID=1645614 RepID=A0A7Y9S7N5_9MICC|nr:GrpB family protein [Psychromicrobium silvestre]NYE94747.1 GrpB-like predicted nucleotidyltransferase (UPF0157 family) [Psychromicrobium silvestre]
MPQEPLQNQRRPDVTETELIGGIEKRALIIEDYNPAWPVQYQEHRDRIATALGGTAKLIEHIGSTSVPGLGAKPIIDVLVTVADITAEENYLDQLLALGYQLRVREPGHRMLRTPERDVHVHLLPTGDPAVEDYLLLRHRLRSDETDRALYERVKRELVSQEWADMNAYADAKTKVITAIKNRARRLPSSADSQA